jgi:hypothetical protein
MLLEQWSFVPTLDTQDVQTEGVRGIYLGVDVGDDACAPARCGTSFVAANARWAKFSFRAWRLGANVLARFAGRQMVHAVPIRRPDEDSTLQTPTQTATARSTKRFGQPGSASRLCHCVAAACAGTEQCPVHW